MRETIKNLSIVFLGLLMAILLVINLGLSLGEDTLQTIGARLGLNNRRDSTQTTLAEPVVLPHELVIRGPEGLYYAGGMEMESLLGAVSPILSEALGSVGKITPISEEVFLQYLTGEHIGFSFTFPVPFYLLQYWWTGETGFSSDQAASMVAVVSWDEAVALIICDGSSGQHYLAETAAGYERFHDQCKAAPTGNAFYAFERDGYHMLESHEAVWSAPVYYTTYALSTPDFSEEGVITDGLLSAFDINPFLAEVYKESDGDIVYIEGYAALQFSKNGRIVYSVTGDGGIDLQIDGSPADKAHRAYTARRVCEVLEQICSGAGQAGGFSIAGITDRSDGYVITCERRLGGSFITEQEGYSAVVTVRDGRITGIRIAMTTATESGSAMLLPMQLATALLEGENSSFCVRYIEQEGSYVPMLYSTGGVCDGVE